MKYVPLFILFFTLVASYFFWGGTVSNAKYFISWVALPTLFSIFVGVLSLKGIFFKNTIPITGAIVSLLALIPYYEAYSYKGVDGQAGLIFAVMPIYQFIIIAVVGTISYITRRLSAGTPQSGAP